MTREELRAQIFQALGEVAPEVDPSDLRPAADLRDAADLDSMDFLRFVIALSARIGVEIPEADYPHVRSLDDLQSYLEAHLGGVAAGDAR